MLAQVSHRRESCTGASERSRRSAFRADRVIRAFDLRDGARHPGRAVRVVNGHRVSDLPQRMPLTSRAVTELPGVESWSGRQSIVLDDNCDNWVYFSLNCSATAGTTSECSSTFEFATQNPIVPDPTDTAGDLAG